MEIQDIHRRAIDEGGVVRIGDKTCTTVAEVEAAMAEAAAAAPAVSAQEPGAAGKHVADLTNALKMAEDALEPFKTRNEAQAELLDVLIGDEAALGKLNRAALVAVAKFEEVEVPDGATTANLTEAILAARKEAN